MINLQNQLEKINLKQGTIEFWMREDKIQWSDNKTNILFNIPVNNTENGSLFMVKDEDNKLKFFHVILGKGRTDVEADVSGLSNKKPHHIVVTWDVNKQTIILYIDGKQASETKIEYLF